MARIAVLASHQEETDAPYRFVKRSAGQSLVRRALAYWVIENAVLRMLPLSTHNSRPDPLTTYRPEIPEGMPPVEVEGTRFIDPVKNPQMPRFVKVHQSERLRLGYELGGGRL